MHGPPPIPVVDAFAGPGGLGEGFAAVGRDARRPWSAPFADGGPRFRVALAIEKDAAAHQTLRLRALFREFPPTDVPEAYYDLLCGTLGGDEFESRFPREAGVADDVAWHAELGVAEEAEVDARVRRAVGDRPDWVLLGGPPCQAYSIVGRSRVGGVRADDGRVRLYRQYVRLLAAHRPPVFVMENVRGLLSAEVDGESVFEALRGDLEDPAAAVARFGGGRFEPVPGYELFALGGPPSLLRGGAGNLRPADFVVKAERHGLPQARHRVILLGVRTDISAVPRRLPQAPVTTVGEALSGLPAVRSGLTKETDGGPQWLAAVRSAGDADWFRAPPAGLSDVRDAVAATLDGLTLPAAGRGCRFAQPFLPASVPGPPGALGAWLTDDRTGVAPGHETRGHRRDDLRRYLFCAAFARIRSVAPTLDDFPEELLPAHASARHVSGGFRDRFRVQSAASPATTVTAHIAKDG